VFFLEKPLQKVEFAEIPRFKRCSTGPSKAVSVTLIPLDFGEKGVYASYTPRKAGKWYAGTHGRRNWGEEAPLPKV
jgi:hypothetical protein